MNGIWIRFKTKFGDNVVMNDLDERVDFFFK